MLKKILNSKLAGYIVGVLVAIGLGESFITSKATFRVAFFIVYRQH